MKRIPLQALSVHTQNNGTVLEAQPGCWKLEIPAGGARAYRLAELDDTQGLSRNRFAHSPPVALEVEARSSAADLPGTWGFGLWNEPFGIGLGQGGGWRLPEWPDAAWFFSASSASHLTLDDRLPGHGFMMQVFRSPGYPAWLLTPFAPALALLALPVTARFLRRLARKLVRHDGRLCMVSQTDWHLYRLEWTLEEVAFLIDNEMVFRTLVSPRGPLGAVIWIDNQFAAFTPDGNLRAGAEASPEPAWIEVRLARNGS
jgi:hypothetical protein